MGMTLGMCLPQSEDGVESLQQASSGRTVYSFGLDESDDGSVTMSSTLLSVFHIRGSQNVVAKGGVRAQCPGHLDSS